MMKIQPYALGRFRLYVPDFKGFEAIEVRKRPRGVGEPVALTSSTWKHASVTTESKTKFDVDGLSLQVLLDRSYTSQVTLTSGTTHDIATQITESCGGYLAILDQPANVLGFTLHTTNVGVGASILCSGDAALALGMPVEEKYGTDIHVQLREGVSEYQYIDKSADMSDTYQFRLTNLAGTQVDAWSAEVSNQTTLVAIPAEIILGTARLMHADGTAARNVLITVAYEGWSNEHPTVTASTQSAYTDLTGEASFQLVRGLPVLVTVHGTDQVRKIRVPTTGNTFDLFDLSISELDDNFKVRIPPFIVGAQRSI